MKLALLAVMVLVGCARPEQPEQKRETSTAVFQSMQGYSCQFQEKTIYIALKENGLGEFIACQDYTIKRHYKVSSGKPGLYDTPRGDFQVGWKAYEWDSKTYPSKDGTRNMDRALFFNKGYALHTGNIKRYSHGCVRTPFKEANWLYNWAEVGTRVIVD